MCLAEEGGGRLGKWRQCIAGDYLPISIDPRKVATSGNAVTRLR